MGIRSNIQFVDDRAYKETSPQVGGLLCEQTAGLFDLI